MHNKTMKSAFLVVCLVAVSSAHADVWWHGWKRAGKAAWENFKKPAVWVPLAGSAAFAATNADQWVSDKAAESDIIFDSPEDARDASNQIKDLSMAAMFVSTQVPVPNDETGRAKRLAVAGMGAVATFGTTQVLKSTITRDRPDDSGDNSFPSNHTSEVAHAMTQVRRNMHTVLRPGGTGRLLTDISIYTVEGVQGWARVEGGKHWPSDVMFSIAMGNWIAGFFYDWFIDDPENANWAVSFGPSDDGESMVLNWSMAL